MNVAAEEQPRRMLLEMTAGEAVNICYRLQATVATGDLLGTDVPPGEWHKAVCVQTFGMATHLVADKEQYR